MNPYLIVILVALIGHYLLELAADLLNVRHVTEELPPEFADTYDAEKYRTSQQYLRENTRFGIIEDTIRMIVMLLFILGGGFNLLDRMARGFGLGAIATGLIFGGILVLAIRLLGLPFSVYRTFVIEERYGFNRTTPATFGVDIIKVLLLTAIIGGPVFACILWLFETLGAWAWLACWAAVSAFQVFLQFAAPYVILPLFNKYVPLEEGELRTAIEDYAEAQDFRMKGIYKMDGSKRSSKSNAFFTGFGKSKRIALFDTLIEKHTVSELVAILAHETGHYKKGHIPKAVVRGVLHTGLMFFLLSFFIKNRGLFDAFRTDQVSIYASLFFFGFLYTPLAVMLGMVENVISRKHEYEADAFAADTGGDAEAFVTGLKKLSVDNLSNLTPHPFKVFLTYSHPPVLDRIRAIRQRAAR